MSSTQTLNTPPLKTDEQNRRLLRIYNLYRVVLSIVLILMLGAGLRKNADLEYTPSLYMYTALAYFAINLAQFFLYRKQFERYNKQAIIITTTDIIALTILTYANGGISSGISNLIIISITAGNLVLTGRLGVFLAAIASIAILYQEIYLSFKIEINSNNYFQAGSLGAIYFATAIFSQKLSQRIRTSEALAKQRALDLVDLQKLNQLIIKRMRTGIIVIQDNVIRMMNESASSLLSINPTDKILPKALHERLLQWQNNSSSRTTPFKTGEDATEVQANFTRLNHHGSDEILIFIEDSLQITHQAQHLKLASLGQLTASIAHEIRNPLGAISHAAQLLQESPNLDKNDVRLGDIIQNHSVRMNNIIENVLQLSKRESSKPETLNLADWVNNFSKTYTDHDFNDININTSHQQTDILINIDPSQLEQVLTNLSHNGLRHSQQQNNKATLSLETGSDNNELPFLNIIDDGPGISDNLVDYVFDPFYTTESSGTGLGLYISRELCESNHARLDYLRTDSGKSCFRISFAHPKRILK